MPRPPRIRKSESCTPVGASAWGYPGMVCEGDYEALLVSEPHRRLKTGAWSGGGPFYCYKLSLKHDKGRGDLIARNSVDLGINVSKGVSPGPLRLDNPTQLAAAVPLWDTVRADAETHYATGYARARPGNPVASIAQFIGELKDLPAVPFKRALKGGASFKSIPRIALRELSDFRNLGSEYLNVVFGWKPFVSDLRKMYMLWHDIDRRMAQIIRENGKAIRRKAGVRNDVEVETLAGAVYPYPYVNVNGAPPNWMEGTTNLASTRVTRTKVWFSGSFRYWIPDTGSSLWDTKARLALFGAIPTPETVWELLPWSWLVDWFSNVGDVISNASPNAVENLTTLYSFIMKRVEVETTHTSHVTHSGYYDHSWLINHWPAVDHTFWTAFKQITKVRSGGGNPFGLNVSFESLSSAQLGILAALGISKSKVR